MRLEQNSFKTQSTMMGESVTMSIAAEDMGHIMGVLSDLYSDRLAAIVREYSTNAYDEHVEAGVSLPIEVSLPTGLEPLLTIRDYGGGLDAEGIRTVYSQYGRSTKRESNDVNGMLGLGSKSALTYGDQFTVVSVKDGQKITVLVSRNDDGAGQMTILGDPVPTDEASGTEIQIAINPADRNRIVQVAADFFKYWEPGKVLVNGKQPEYFADAKGVLQITPNIYVAPYSGRDRIVMGNVSYPARLTNSGNFTNYNIIAIVPIGSVRPTPSREELMDVKLTNDTLAKIAAEAQDAIGAEAARQIENAKTGFEAIKKRNEWYRIGIRPNVLYKGQGIPSTIRLNMAERAYRGHTHIAPTNNFTMTRMCPSDTWDTMLFVENFNVTSGATIQHKRKVLKYCEDNGIDLAADGIATIMLLPLAPSRMWVDPSRVLDWQKVKTTKLPAAARTVTQKKKIGSYECRTPGNGWEEMDASEIDTKHPIIYVPTHTGWRLEGAVTTALKDYTLVKMPSNRLDKFKRLFPQAIEITQFVRDNFEKALKKLPEAERMSYAYAKAGLSSRLRQYDPKKIDDPELVQAIAAASVDSSRLRTLVQGAQDALGAEVKGLPKVTNPLAPYPLATLVANSYGGEKYREHIYFYINALYKARQKGLAI